MLGAGGMGEVYQARDGRLNRMVALKILATDIGTDSERHCRFVQERSSRPPFQHPNIVTVFDIGHAGEVEYLAMELVRGRSLQRVIPDGGLCIQDALRYAIEIADALSAAHEAGIVHRGSEARHIMVTDDGRIKVVDFGLATLAEHGLVSDTDETREQPLNTGLGTVLGSVAYMSPEQAEGKKLDARSDLFSFGAILYEIVSGQRAFRADSTAATLAAVIDLEPRPLPTLVENVPEPLEKLDQPVPQKGCDPPGAARFRSEARSRRAARRVCEPVCRPAHGSPSSTSMGSV